MRTILTILTFLIITSCEIAFIEDISNQSVSLIAPVNNSEIVAGSLNFHWDDVSEAENYKLQIATPTFEIATQIILDTIVSSTSFNKELITGEYQWRVKAMNSQYETNYSINSFTVN